MNSDKVAWLLDKVAESPSLRIKQSLIEKYAHGLELRRVLEYAYNPFKHYGGSDINWLASEVASGKHVGFKPFTEYTWSVLNKIANKNIRGSTANDMLLKAISGMTKESAELLIKLLRKNLRAGISAGIINKAIPDLIPVNPYMRCSIATLKLLNRYNLENGAFVQEKMDGMYASISHHHDDDWTATTRSGITIPNVILKPIFLGLAKTPIGYQLHGELVVLENGKPMERSRANGILNQLINTYNDSSVVMDLDDHVDIVFYVWDIVSLREIAAGRSELMYGIRFKMIQDCILKRTRYVKVVKTEICKSVDEILKVSGRMVRAGAEGSIVKNWFGPWIDGTSLDQAKIKPTFESDLKIIGILPGAQGTKLENKPASCICETEDRVLTVVVPIKDESMRRSIQRNENRWLGKIMKVIANNVTTTVFNEVKNHSLLHARFAESQFRADKDAADTIDRVLEQRKSLLNGDIKLDSE